MANSLAIMTDAAHLLSDFAGFMISLLALWVATKPATPTLSFGWHRAGTREFVDEREGGEGRRGKATRGGQGGNGKVGEGKGWEGEGKGEGGDRKVTEGRGG